MERTTILIIDDDYASMEPLKKSLAVLCNYQVHLTAKETLPTDLSTDQFDLICLDLMIHRDSLVPADTGEPIVVRNIHFDDVGYQETGLEFLVRLRQGRFSDNGTGTPSTVPVIVLSATADQDTIDRVEEIGKTTPTWYMEKPFLLASVIAQIRTAIKEA